MTADHNTPDNRSGSTCKDPVSRNQLDTFAKNAVDFNMPVFIRSDIKNGWFTLSALKTDFTQLGMTIVCGDSHTSTHGALEPLFWHRHQRSGNGFGTQCILQTCLKTMRITFNGKFDKGVTAKDLALYMISKLTTEVPLVILLNMLVKLLEHEHGRTHDRL